MTKYVAFLRGINVGGRIVKMADLKSCLETHGMSNVKTVLQTGNVIFESSALNTLELASKLEVLIGEQFEYPAHVLVRELSDVTQVVQTYPFDSTDRDSQHYGIFLKEMIDPNELANEEIDDSLEAVKAGNGAVYWKVQRGMTVKSIFSKQLTKAKYKEHNTVRNIKTLQKIVDKG